MTVDLMASVLSGTSTVEMSWSEAILAKHIQIFRF